MTNRRLLLIAERDVLARAAVAAALIVGLIVAAVATAHAAPVIECDRFGCHETRHVQRVTSKRPADCYGIPWCGCWARHQVGLPKPFNSALHWLTLRHVGKRIGAWAVMRRRGGGHVGKVVRFDASGNPVILSGNHGGRVGVGIYDKHRVVAYVEP